MNKNVKNHKGLSEKTKYIINFSYNIFQILAFIACFIILIVLVTVGFGHINIWFISVPETFILCGIFIIDFILFLKEKKRLKIEKQTKEKLQVQKNDKLVW